MRGATPLHGATRALAAAALVVAGRATPAGAQVGYYTTGAFSGGSTPGTNVYTAGGFQIVYTAAGSPSAPVFTAPQTGGAGFGYVSVPVTNNFGLPATIGGTFTLTIFTVSPVGGASGQLVATLSGLLDNNYSRNTAVLDATGAGSVVVGGTQFSYLNLPLAPPRYSLFPSNTSILQGTAVAAVPEPGTLGLVAAGGLALGGVAARRRRA